MLGLFDRMSRIKMTVLEFMVNCWIRHWPNRTVVAVVTDAATSKMRSYMRNTSTCAVAHSWTHIFYMRIYFIYVYILFVLIMFAALLIIKIVTVTTTFDQCHGTCCIVQAVARCYKCHTAEVLAKPTLHPLRYKNCGRRPLLMFGLLSANRCYGGDHDGMRHHRTSRTSQRGLAMASQHLPWLVLLCTIEVCRVATWCELLKRKIELHLA